jgi:hypothetical protein
MTGEKTTGLKTLREDKTNKEGALMAQAIDADL